jgi:hypothetical protein
MDEAGDRFKQDLASPISLKIDAEGSGSSPSAMLSSLNPGMNLLRIKER